jgi:hypothetical protein
VPQATLPLYTLNVQETGGQPKTITFPDDVWGISAVITKAILHIEHNLQKTQMATGDAIFTIYFWKDGAWVNVGDVRGWASSVNDWKTKEIDVLAIITGLTSLKFYGTLELPRIFIYCPVWGTCKAYIDCEYESGDFTGTGTEGTFGSSDIGAIFDVLMQFMYMMMFMNMFTVLIGVFSG